MGGILAGADKLSRAAPRRSDPALAEVLGIEGMPSRSPRSRFLGRFGQATVDALSRVPAWAVARARPWAEAVLDWDSGALVHADGHQEGGAGATPARDSSRVTD
jgi:hypothetical protein